MRLTVLIQSVPIFVDDLANEITSSVAFLLMAADEIAV